MNGPRLVEISQKKVLSPAIQKQLQELNRIAHFKGIKCLAMARLVYLEGGCSPLEVEKIARELLCDPVSEIYEISKIPFGKEEIFADVWYKPGVTDPAAQSVLKAVLDLDIRTVSKAHTGIRYKFKTAQDPLNNGRSGENQIQRFMMEHLLNPLVQECRIIKQ